MSRSTHEVAKDMGLHPANLVACLASIGAPFSECWPEVKMEWLENLKQTDWKRFSRPLRVTTTEMSIINETDLGVSYEAAFLIDKLCRKKHWGDNDVSFDTLRNHYCQKILYLESCLDELIKLDLILRGERKNTFSLNTAKKQEIDKIASTFKK